MGVAGLIAALAGRPARRWYALLLAAAVDADPQSARGGRAGLAALVRGGGRAARRRRAAAARRSRGGCPAPRGRGRGDHGRRDRRDGAADGAALRAALARRAAREPARGARDRARDVARRARRGRGPDRRAAGTAVRGADRAAARLPPGRRARHRGDAGSRSVELHAPPPRSLPAWAALLGGGDARRPLLAPRSGPRRRPRAGRGHARRRRAARGRGRRVAAAAIVGAFAAPPRAPPRPGELVVSFLDVGQGDATLIQLGATTVLVDTGPPDGPILEAARAGPREATRRALPDPRRGGPRGRGARGDPRLRAAPRSSTAARAGTRRSSARCRPPRRAPGTRR